MKPANEIHEALQKVEAKLAEMRETYFKLGNNLDVIKNLIDAREEVSTAAKKYSIDFAVEMFANVAMEEVEDIEALLVKATDIAQAGLSEPEAVEGEEEEKTPPRRPTEAELRDIFREAPLIIEKSDGGEDKQLILNKLWRAIHETLAGEDVINLRDNGDGTMTIFFIGGHGKNVNIECDSGIAMIVDVCRALM